ncbi:FAD-dependent oxidoreductase [Mycobacterium intracellulare]|uniref:ferredoxin--NADP(+) reductase n=1 Tax=Mycobacterium intracellulare TaxID=1767 RepID=A0AAE4RHC6_MYCIT|nr:FAD-dependent oxidoreductase [Mycobacterium intracellulare]MCA2322485.1 FAD-dependent oxidoreductase [Mycobacterium intracellulare]MCA2342477.1 FAD-dependent oxidoreductase [Mycobacterium intracellulare]MDV6977304.1 FAD-dependent oxidoreductase [Mycobacterium intracellulare]MDV6982785.1 FAD-dependent oxidoreductase [Mycobacterium intracellulare]MDV7013011.1 FAD-dependent oxidoreductase [Mycobacterium intracellulare]
MRPYHVAIVGSGPSGFFAASSLLKAADASQDTDVAVDMLEMLPTPWGLVRSGVAPDHPKIKSISKQFEKTAQDPRFRFFGNVSVGEHVQASELAERYDAVIYAVGAQSDRALNIPGEELPGSIAAVDFVGWYNAHPNFEEATPDLSGARAVVVGNGNVALDVARILVTDPDVLGQTDIADHALESLRPCGVDEVVVIGRRGPLQTAFTTLELRELGELENVDVIVDPAQLEGVSDEDAAAAGKTAKQNINVLRDYAKRSPRPGHRRIVLRFMTSPIEIKGEGRVERIVLGRNELVTDANGRVSANDTGVREELPVQLVVRSVGYRGVPTPGLPFDEKTATIPNSGGRVDGSRNEYVVGWIKRGPTGVIGTNKKDSQDTVDTLLADLASAARPDGGGLTDFPDDHADQLAEWLASRQPKLVTSAHWELIDAHERAAGEPHGRPRVKLPSLAKLLRVSHG